MASLADRWDRWKRRRFGTYWIEDPRSTIESAPYTYFIPSENEVLALEPGDLVKLNFFGKPGGATFEAERMWVTLLEVSSGSLVGSLDNQPFELHQLRVGDVVRFGLHNVIDLIWSENRKQAPPPHPPRREYWDRCLVDRCVLDDGAPIYYLYREEPDMADPDDKYPDSGWRIRGDYRALTDEEFEACEVDYIALGKVLNEDDSWLHLIDAPIGSAFIRDEHSNEFVPDERDEDGDGDDDI